MSAEPPEFDDLFQEFYQATIDYEQSAYPDDVFTADEEDAIERINKAQKAVESFVASREEEIERLRGELNAEFQRRNLIEESIAQQLTPDEASKAWNAVTIFAPATNFETRQHYYSLIEKLDATRHSEPTND